MGFSARLLTLLGVCVFAADAWAEQLLYLAAARDRAIATYVIDGEDGRLTERSRVELSGTLGPMAFSPDGRFVYAAVEDPKLGEGVATLRRLSDGSLELLGAVALASQANYLSTDPSGRHLLAAHYWAGELSVTRIRDGIATGEPVDREETHKGAHSIVAAPSGAFVLAPHTTPNKVYQFRFDPETGELTPNTPPFALGPDAEHDYHEPRHYAQHPSLDVAYTSNERGGGISAWKLDPSAGTLTLLQTLSTLPPGYQGQGAAADIQLTPDGRFAYVANRDYFGSPEDPKDTLAVFALDPETGAMTGIGHFPAPHFPRSFAIDRSGRFLYAAGRRADALFAYRIDPETGALHRFARYETPGEPVWVMCGASAEQSAD